MRIPLPSYLFINLFFVVPCLCIDVLPNVFDEVPALHLPIYRRRGSFESFAPEIGEFVDWTRLKTELDAVRARYNLTRRVIRGNKIVRVSKTIERDVVSEEERSVPKSHNGLIGSVGVDGRWRVHSPECVQRLLIESESRYAKFRLGEPAQELEVDLDMLSSDFYVLTTTSGKGSRFDDLFSKTHVRSSEQPFPGCKLSTDSFQFPGAQSGVLLQFPYCRPSKSSSSTLGLSGSVIGLAPSRKMTQINGPLPVSQLLKRDIIKRPIFSLMLINGHEGVLSLGGTTITIVDMVQRRSENALARLGRKDSMGSIAKHDLEKRRIGDVHREMSWEDHWKWSKVQGADGWWQILIQAVLVNGRKVLKNQPSVLDINTPFILAPRQAAATFYAAIPGAQQLPSPHDGFYTFPCLNPPSLALEFGGWNFPIYKGSKGMDHEGRQAWGRPGGRLSLGRLEKGSGFCVGAIVGIDLGDLHSVKANDDLIHVRGKRRGLDRERRAAGARVLGNGMKDVWVIGEPWFRGASCVFDLKQHRIGVRSA